MAAAEAQIDRLIKANKRHKVGIWIQGVLIVALCVVAGILSFVVIDQHNTDAQQRHDVVAQCEAGNSYRAGQTEIWNKLFALSFGYKAPNKNSEVYKLDNEFLNYVHQVDAPRDCSVYNASTNVNP